MDPRDLTIIVNTGDDIVLHGLKISRPGHSQRTPSRELWIGQRLGFRQKHLMRFKCWPSTGRANWFHLGDRDLATHIHRTAMLAEGKSIVAGRRIHSHSRWE